MPLGWYLAQGLVPVTASSSDDEEGPCELPDGRIVCGPHGLAVCGKCCTAYPDPYETDTDSQEKDSDDDDSPGLSDHEATPIRTDPKFPGFFTAMVRGTGQVFPSKFVPPNNTMTPMEVFASRHQHMSIARCVQTRDRSKVLIMADGACLNNGQANPKAGWAFFQGEKTNGEPLVVSDRLEKKGPWGEDGAQTSNRAELRAVIAALRFRHWRGEGFSTVVMAVDSSYVVDGATQWAKGWVMNGWKTSERNDVKNKDLWEILLGECERARDNNLEIQFWKIPREWNMLADEGAKKGAEGEAPEEWSDIMGMAC